MFLEKHGTAKFPMEEVTGLDQALLPAVQRLIDDGYLFAHRFYSTAYVTQAGIRAYQEGPYAEKISLSSKNRRKPERTPNVPLIARTLIRMLRSNSATTGG